MNKEIYYFKVLLKENSLRDEIITLSIDDEDNCQTCSYIIFNGKITRYEQDQKIDLIYRWRYTDTQWYYITQEEAFLDLL